MAYTLSEITACIKNLFAMERAIYKLSEPGYGVNRRVWDNPDAVPHANVADIFTGPVDPITGFPTHPNNRTIQDIAGRWIFNQADFPNNGTTQMEAWGWISTIGLGRVLLRDTNNNTGERGEFFLAPCCGVPKLQLGYNDDVTGDTSGQDRDIMDPTSYLDEGVHFAYMRMSDFSAFSGIHIQYTTDLTGQTGWTNVTAAMCHVEKPYVLSDRISMCEPVPSGWQINAPALCSPQFAPANDVAPVPEDWRCEEVFMALGNINLTVTGEVAPFSCPNGAEVIRTGVGTYQVVSAPAGANSTQIQTIVDVDSRDGLHAHHDGSFTQGVFWVGTGDNGAAPDILVDAPLSIKWFGKRTVVICDAA